MRHARHFATLTPRAELIAVCSPVQAELDAAQSEFPGVRAYKDYETMLNSERGLQAVVVASATTVHAEQAIKAIERGLHVLCEKPLSTSPEIVRSLPSKPSMKVESRVNQFPVPIRGRRVQNQHQEIPLPKSNLRLLPPLRRLLPGRTRTHGKRTHRDALRLPLTDMRQARSVRVLRRVRRVLGWDLR